MTIYHRKENNKILNLQSYQKGNYYKHYFIYNGQIRNKLIFNERTKSLEEEEEYRSSLLANLNTTVNYILHNHVDPISPEVYNYLTNNGKNIYIYRKDKLAQLASYAIAYQTKEFSRFNEIKESNDKIEITDEFPLINLIKRIKIWEELEKQDTIAYEDINFVNLKGMPIKQNKNFRERLTTKSLNIIENLLKEYYYPKSI